MQDDILLTRYLQDGSEAAFSQLVTRHLPLVYRACLRETGSAAQAEDAAQVVFLLLACKAKSLQDRSSLTGWLYQTAVFVAKNVHKQEARRKLREHSVMQEAVDVEAAPRPNWDTVEPLLNAALSALKSADREAVLLRFVEGHTLAETGALLGLTEDAARMRVTRALEKLRRYLTAHGAAVTGVLLTALLTTEAASPVPAQAAATITQGTLQAISTGPVPNVLLLSKGVSHTMKLIKVKYAALAAGLLIAGASVPPLVHAIGPHKASVKTVAEATPLMQNVTQTFSLDKDQHAFFRVTLPKGASTVVLDMRRADSRKGSMTVNVDFIRNSALNALSKTKPLDGISVGAVLDTESRMIVGSALKQPIPVVLDVHNQGVPCRYWLTDLKTPSTVTASAAQSSPAFALPMYGEVVPKPIALGETETGRLEKSGHAYFRVALKAGRYQSLLSFSRVDGKSTDPAPVDGELTLSDENGFRLFDDEGAPAPLASSNSFFKDVNELHASQSPDQDAAKFELKQDGEFLVTLSNQASSTTADNSAPVNFTEQIVPDNSQPTLTKQN